jgi:formylglycine-generating enzyme required for sulfatase activity
MNYRIIKQFVVFAFALFIFDSTYGESKFNSCSQGGAKEAYTDPLTQIELVLIKGGCFKMGNIFGDGDPDEKPTHLVCVDDFYLSKFETTQKQWRMITDSNPSQNKKGDEYPVDAVTKWEVDEYIKQLNKMAADGFRLPTEAEWEYACRSGGKKLRYGTHNDQITGETANQEGEADGYIKSAPVGSYPPNLLGLFDMSGNVSEWTADWYDREYYTYSPKENPKGADAQKARHFARRGGSWYNKSRYLSCSIRNWRDPGFRLMDLGFRLARDCP